MRNFLVLAGLIAVIWLTEAANASEVSAQPLRVTAVSLQPEKDGTEILSISLSEPVAHRAFLLLSPPRIVIDLPPFQWRVNQNDLQHYAGKLVQNIRYARFDPHTSRVVLDLQQAATLLPQGKTARNEIPQNELRFLLKATGHHQLSELPPAQPGLIPQDMTLELAKREATTPPPDNGPSQATYAPATLPREITPPDSYQPALAKPSVFALGIPVPRAKPPAGFSAVGGFDAAPARIPLVVIDAGHGGQDPGTIGNSKSKEKEITLAYARALRDALVATGRYRATLTREDDRFILLRERFRIARRQKADLFLSLHADSAPTTTAHGLSIYTLSEDASDAESAALAAQENKVDVLAEVDLGTQDEEVAGILIDLARRETTNKSVILADSIVAGLRGRVPLLPNTHRYAGFAVLKAPDIPSALVEIGFLSNPEEERKILTREYRTKVVNGLMTGISKFFVSR